MVMGALTGKELLIPKDPEIVFTQEKFYNLLPIEDSIFFCLFLFRAISAAYGGSQARGPIGAVAAGLR